MLSTSSLADAPIVGAKGKTLGWVNHVLFHPTELRVVGVEMRLKPLAYVVELKPKYYAWDALEIGDEQLAIKDMKDVSGSSAAKRLEIDWDTTVIWMYQFVKTAKDREMGQVSNVRFADDGTVRELIVSGGLTADVAVGKHAVNAEDIIGFDGESIRVADASNEAATSGGVAASAGKGAAVAKHQATKAADGALKVGVAAARAASKSEVAKSARKGWLEFSDAFKEGLKGDKE